ncbi:uncharacterized protein BO96DRAFT_231029 [Aspergillus niger CBS 101883]|uniref:uncharacterized protein n=1 Tax=Aspergillus lacticoffeatus (strain CBS 101883) TaxID=1450533 RepID=UPI000D803236|nr:uncharacterized protein BO96DRAFT_231029 [Aspergillus niger CBS 101883]PYH58982.1 hypothetical protein BO96DRAFT_231029 [Aspergillus niger CBS 101883]
MIGFLLSAKVNDSNKGRTRAADRIYRKEKKAKSTAACACMGPWPSGWALLFSHFCSLFYFFYLPGMTSSGALSSRNRVITVVANRWRKPRMGQIGFHCWRLAKREYFLWARRRTQKRCAQFHGSDHTRNITAGRSMTAEKGVEEPGRGAGESWWCGLADWTGGLHVDNYYNHLVKSGHDSH